MNILKSASLVLSISLLIPISLLAETPQEQEKIQAVKVHVRIVPVKVFDKSGNPVKGLKAEDFRLKIDGKEKEIQSTDEYDYELLRESVRKGQKLEAESSSLPRRRIMMIFDLYGKRGDIVRTFHRRGIHMLKIAAKKWIDNELLPTDEVAVVAYYYAPLMIQSFTSNKDALRQAVDDVPMPLIVFGSTYQYLGFYRRLGELMAGMRGTKEIFLFSMGVPMQSETNIFYPELKQATESLGSANCRVTTIGIAGLEQRRTSAETELLYSLAAETGGKYFRAQSRLDKPMRWAAESLDHYYELSFAIPEEESDDFHKLSVEVENRDARTEFPAGYYGTKEYNEMSDRERDIQLAAELWSRMNTNDLNADISMRQLPYGSGKAFLHLRSMIPLNEFFDEGETRELEAEINLSQGGELFDSAQWKIVLKKDELNTAQIDLAIPLPTGRSVIQFVLRDNETGKSSFFFSKAKVTEGKQESKLAGIYLVDASAEKDSASIEQTIGPNQLTDAIPAEIVQLMRTPAFVKATAGENLELKFLHAGLKLDQYLVKLKSGGKEQQIMLDVKKSIPVGKDLQIVSLNVVIPDWVKESLDIEVLSRIDDKTVSIGKEKLSVEEKTVTLLIR